METILVTGASGSMGGATFRELLKQKDDYKIVLLLRDSRKHRKDFSKYEKEGIKIVWGDLRIYEDVKRAVEGVDAVLHPAALISPEADHKPETAMATNHGGIVNIIRAIKEEPKGASRIKLVSIGSVAMYGDRLPPYHMIRTGDPIMPSIGDFYSLSKIMAEREVIESGLKYWVSIRQTYIAIPNVFGLMDPIMYHQPPFQHMEPVTDTDSGIAMVNTLKAPEEFWRNIYNMGGGEAMRINYRDYLNRMFAIFGIDAEKCMRRNWFTIRNFHCGYFADSSKLNDYLKFQNESIEDHIKQASDATPKLFRAAKIVPPGLIRAFMRPMAEPLKWIKNPNKYPSRVQSFYGNVDNWKEIGSWEDLPAETPQPIMLDHGYEEKTDENYSIEDMKKAAEFRGGECLSDSFEAMDGSLKWRCAFGHTFDGSANLILKGGHWCPECAPPAWKFHEIARVSPFHGQLYYHNHTKDEDFIHTKEQCMAETAILE